MKALTLATQMILVVTVVIGGFSYFWEWLRDRRLKRYDAMEHRIPMLWAQGTFRKKER